MQKARPFIILTVVVAMLVAALAIVDSVARSQAENMVADRAQTSLHLSSKPTATLHGWPFLVHALTRSFPRADVSTTDAVATVGGKELPLANLNITATGIEPDGDNYVLKHVEARATVGYEALSGYAGSSTIGYRENGRIAITYTTDIFGQKLQAVVTGVPVLDVGRQEVNLQDTAVEVAEVKLTDELSRTLIRTVAKTISVRQANVTVQSLEAQQDGVVVSATADNYTVSG